MNRDSASSEYSAVSQLWTMETMPAKLRTPDRDYVLQIGVGEEGERGASLLERWFSAHHPSSSSSSSPWRFLAMSLNEGNVAVASFSKMRFTIPKFESLIHVLRGYTRLDVAQI